MGSITLDFSFAKSPLFVRQTVASAFGIPLEREFAWDSLTTQICASSGASQPDRLSIVGLSHLGVALPSEAKSFGEFLCILQAKLPSLKVLVTLHD